MTRNALGIRAGAGFSPLLARFPESRPIRKKRRARRPFPAPCRSSRLYVEIAPGMVHMFRFFLETEDNLGIMTVVDRWRAVLMIRFSPHQEKAVRVFLDSVREPLGLAIIEMRPYAGTGV